MKFLIVLFLCGISCSLLEAACCNDNQDDCCGQGGGSSKGRNRLATLDGWKAVDVGRTPGQNITIPGTADDAFTCLQRCYLANPLCYVVSFSYNTQTCTGFTRKAMVGFQMDVDSILLSRSDKKMKPAAAGVVVREDAIPATRWSGITTPYVPNVGNSPICNQLCVMQPRCNYAVHSANKYQCWLNDALTWTMFHTAEVVSANQFAAYWSQ